MKHTSWLRPALLTLAATTLCLPAAAADITYKGAQSFDGATVNLVLTTDGTIGNLLPGNFVSFKVTISDSGGTAIINNANGSIYEPTCCSQFNTTATAKEIDFSYDDYVGGEFLLFQEGSVGGGGPFYCLSPNVCWSGSPSYSEEGANSQASSGGGASGAIAREAAYPSSEMVATTVPEPAAWFLLLSGTALCGGVRRFRRARRAVDARPLGMSAASMIGPRTLAVGSSGVALAAALFAGTPASATTIVTTFTGTVSSANDSEGYFGAAPIVGDAFTAVFTTDDTVPAASLSSNPPEESGITGQADIDYSCGCIGIPPTTATLTIAGHSFAIPNNEKSTVTQATAAYAGNAFIYYLVKGDADEGEQGLGFYFFPTFPISWNYQTPASYDIPSGTPTTFAELYYDPYCVIYGNCTFSYENIQLTPTHLTVAVEGVPEPATWALLLSGVSGIGVVLRGRRRGRFVGRSEADSDDRAWPDPGNPRGGHAYQSSPARPGLGRRGA